MSLERRNPERLGAEAEAFAGKVRSGWPERMENFALYEFNGATVIAIDQK